MVSFQLNESLHTISLASNLSDLVFDLIQWAEARGAVEPLIIAARTRNPGNEDLRLVAEHLGVRIAVYQGPEPPQIHRAKIEKLLVLLGQDFRTLQTSPAVIETAEQELRDTISELRNLGVTYARSTLNIELLAVLAELSNALSALYRAWDAAEAPTSDQRALFSNHMISCRSYLRRSLARFPSS
jgi:hypothetical protein